MKYRKKPVEVEAIRWTGKNTGAVRKWIMDVARSEMQNIATFVTKKSITAELWKNIAADNWGDDIAAAIYDYLHETYVGVMEGQWIICGVAGEFYPCDDSTFKVTYEPVEQ